mmetsp:Transcript_60266/g.108378  ORF Transcript_60266/g.108378 Transcript_60266/m.108378 type:complete len:80 (+) Transcript_60266:109-348(+)
MLRSTATLSRCHLTASSTPIEGQGFGTWWLASVAASQRPVPVQESAKERAAEFILCRIAQKKGVRQRTWRVHTKCAAHL